MAVRKSDVHAPASTLRSPQSYESNILDNSLKEKVGIKESPLSRLSGSKVEVTYFKQRSYGDNNYLINTNSFNSIDPNIARYEMIKNLLVVSKQALELETNSDESGVFNSISGTLIILPRTVKPNPNDLIMMKVMGNNNLYRITNIGISSIEGDSSFSIDIVLFLENFNLETHTFKNCIEENYVFEYKHIGTSFRSIFREEEYDALKQLNVLYHRFFNIFMNNFYNKILNTFIMNYTTIQNDVVNYESTDGANFPQTDNTALVGRELFDSYVNEFIMKNEIFTNNSRIYSPTSYSKPDIRLYNTTVFKALEDRNSKHVVSRFFMPMTILRATPGILPIMVGKTELFPTVDLISGCVTLLPPDLIMKMKGMVDTSDAYTQQFYPSYTDFINDIIALFVNTKDNKLIIPRLVSLASHVDEFHDSCGKIEYLFYLLPIISYITLNCIDELSKEEITH